MRGPLLSVSRTGGNSGGGGVGEEGKSAARAVTRSQLLPLCSMAEDVTKAKRPDLWKKYNKSIKQLEINHE